MNPTDCSTILTSDEEIVERILKGEKHLFENLMRKFNPRLYRIGMSIINVDEEVEDVMQTAYLNAYLHLGDFLRKSSFSTWLTRIFINESLLNVRKKQKHKVVQLEKQENFSHDDTPLNSLMNNELKTILEKSIGELPEKYRMIFVMREIEDMSINETMELLSLSESNVKVRLNRAKEMLRNNLSAQYKSPQVFDFHLSRCNRVVNQVMTEIVRIDFQISNF